MNANFKNANTFLFLKGPKQRLVDLKIMMPLRHGPVTARAIRTIQSIRSGMRATILFGIQSLQV
ncbi:hypothetical protein CCR91_21165 [Thiorhodovibrio winogradskyi]|nr:hypothetical protein [Thiorhodovibrio winogradskyi]